MPQTDDMKAGDQANAPPYVNFPLVRVRALKHIAGGGALKHKLTTLVAPIGYGKTVLMNMVFSELQRTGKQCVWIGLDERNATLESILDRIISQLKLHEPQAHPTGALLSGNASAEQRIDNLVKMLRTNPLPVAIFIDNLNFCTDPAIALLIGQLSFDTAPRIQIVLSTTEDLPLNRARAELEGLLLPLGPDDLRLDLSEVEQIFPDELKAKLTQDGMQTVLDRTEGWPAAVRMMQIILERSADIPAMLASVSGSHHMLAELLNGEILSRLDDDLKAHLLELSLLHRFSNELCHYVWPEPGSAKMRDNLFQRNILMVPLDSDNIWFRFHGLLRDFLITEAASTIPNERREEIYRRAARWCERNDLWRGAIEYALAGGAFDHAAFLLGRFAEQAVRDSGQIAKFLEWAEILLKNGVMLEPQTEYWFIWAFAFRRQYDVAKRRLHVLQKRLTAAGDGSGEPGLQRQVSLLRASIDSLTDNSQEARQEAATWLAGAKDRDDPFEVCAAHCIVGNAHTSQHNFVQARRALQSAKLAGSETRSIYVNGWVATYSSLVAIAEGSYSEAYFDLVREITHSRSELADNGGITGALALVAAKCAVEMGLEQEARELLGTGLPNLRTHGFLEVAACGLSAAVALWDGVSVSPFDRRSLQEIADSYPPRLSLMLGCFVTKRMIELGRVEDAVSEASRIGMRTDLANGCDHLALDLPQVQDIFAITHAELLLSVGNPEPATKLIENGIARARAQRRMAKLVNWLLLKAQYASGGQNTELAKGALVEAIRFATRRRIKRPFLLRRKRLAQTMGEISQEHATFALDAERLYFLELFESMGLAELGEQGDEPYQSLEPQLLDRLTPRELDLLRLVSTGMSNEQIGGRLNISKTTVKWHLQNVFGKLNVKNRSAAVAHARILGLVG